MGRQLYGEQKTFRPFFKIILLCNNIPEIDAVDKAVWLRCRCLSFPTSFVLNPTAPNERKLDQYLSTKLPGWCLAFFHLLLKYFQIYMVEGLKMTPNMLERTGDYRVESDIYLRWLNERTVASDTASHICDLYEDFKRWHLINGSGTKLPNPSSFVKGLRLHKEVKKNVWLNHINKQGIEGLRLVDSTLLLPTLSD